MLSSVDSGIVISNFLLCILIYKTLPSWPHHLIDLTFRHVHKHKFSSDM